MILFFENCLFVKKKIIKKIFFCLASTPLLLCAQPLALEDALKLSLTYHPSIESKKSDFSSAQSDTEAAQWQQWPSLSAQATSLEKNQYGYTKKEGTTLTVEQPLFTGWKITAAIEGAQSRENVAKNAIHETQKEVQLRVLDAYAMCVKLAQKVEYAKANYQEHERLFNSIENRLTGGISSETDVALANARMRQAKSDLTQLLLAQQNALSTLSLLVGKEVTSVTEFNDTLKYTNLKEALKEAELNSPTLFRLKDEIDVALADKKSKESLLYPQIALKFENYTGLNKEINNESNRIFLTATYQMGAGLSASSNIESAQKKVLTSHSNYDSGKLDIKEKVTTQYNEAVAYLSQVADAQMYAQENDNVAQSYERQYVIGKKSWLDLLNVKRESTQSKYNYVDTKINAVHAVKKLHILVAKESE